MKIDEIKTIVRLMSENDLTEFKIESEEMTLCLRRASTNHAIPTPAPITYVPASVAAPVTAPDVPSKTLVNEAVPATPVDTPPSHDKIIESPTVGTFYRSASPGMDPLVKIGSHVEPDTVVAIVEAMKVMNEIKAEKSGVIKEILLENGQPVEYGQPLFVLE